MTLHQTAHQLNGMVVKILQFLIVEIVLLPLARACNPNYYPDKVVGGDCTSCDDICDPKFDTLSECRRTPECAGVIARGLRDLYDDAAFTRQPAEVVTQAACPTQEALQDITRMPLTIGLSVILIVLALILTAFAFFKFGGWWERRSKRQKTNGPFAQEVGPELYVQHPHDRLLPSGSTSASTSTSSGSSYTLDLQAENVGTH